MNQIKLRLHTKVKGTLDILSTLCFHTRKQSVLFLDHMWQGYGGKKWADGQWNLTFSFVLM